MLKFILCIIPAFFLLSCAHLAGQYYSGPTTPDTAKITFVKKGNGVLDLSIYQNASECRDRFSLTTLQYTDTTISSPIPAAQEVAFSFTYYGPFKSSYRPYTTLAFSFIPHKDHAYRLIVSDSVLQDSSLCFQMPFRIGTDDDKDTAWFTFEFSRSLSGNKDRFPPDSLKFWEWRESPWDERGPWCRNPHLIKLN
jgi:hypothetical protein